MPFGGSKRDYTIKITIMNYRSVRKELGDVNLYSGMSKKNLEYIGIAKIFGNIGVKSKQSQM